MNTDNNTTTVRPVPKICFNPCCNNKGKNWISVIGRYSGFEDLETPYCICDECNSFLGVGCQAQNHLVNMLQGMGKVHRFGVDIEAHNATSGKITITTKELNNLTFETSAYCETEPDPKICYNLYCNNKGNYWIDIVNSTTLLADHEILYCICDKCYTFFEYRRKDPLIFKQPKNPLDALQIPNSKEEEIEFEIVSGINPLSGKECITTKDLHNILESTQIPKKSITLGSN